MDSAKLINELEAFIRSSNVNLGRNSQNKEKFITKLLEMVRSSFTTPKQNNTKKVKIPNKENIMTLKPNEKVRKRLNNTSNMTEQEAMRADEELGRSPFE